MIRNRYFLGIVLIIILGTAGYFAYTNFIVNPNETQAAEEELQTSPVRRGNISISAAGVGSVIPATEISLGFESGGIIIEIPVAVGVKVSEGEILARLDDADVQQALASAELQLQQAESEKQIEEELNLTAAGISVEQAEIQLEIAQSALDDLLNFEPDPNDIAIAEANLEAAQAGLESVQGQSASSSYSLQIQQISLQQAERDLASAQEAYDIAWDPARDWETQYTDPICGAGQSIAAGNCSNTTYAEQIDRERESTANGLVRAQENLTIAQASYNSSVVNAGSSTANAESQILSAEQALRSATEGPTEDEIEAAQRQLRQAELSLDQARLNNANSALNTTISIEQAKLAVQNAQNNLEDIILRAPMDGTIMSIEGNVGEQIGTGIFMSLANLDQPVVEIFIDETDLDKITVGNGVTVEFDAIPEIIFDGEIIALDPQLSDQGGLSVIRGLVQLAPSSELPTVMPVGMNASVEVIGAEANNVLIVPIEALREISDGQYGLFVIVDGEPQFRSVEVGLQDFTFAEIISGVDQGEEVSTGIIETN